MNEFIVWDEERKRFMGEGEVIFSNYGDIKIVACPNSIDYVGDKTHDYYDENRWSFFQSIGITDIDGKKIYADCNIVKIYYRDNVFCFETNGYFTYDIYSLSYIFKSLSDDNFYFIRKIEKLEIIDTIQENKLGLMKWESSKTATKLQTLWLMQLENIFMIRD